MPLWLIHHPPATFDNQESKAAFAADITELYTNLGLPAFYVVVKFIPTEVSNLFVGGEPRTNKPFIRIVIDHIAVHMDDSAKTHQQATSRVDDVLKRHIAEKGYDWEYHIDETPRGLWKVNGLIPPPYKSEDEKKWVQANAPLEWEGGRL
ncbi:hypothetical protein LCI18_013740 [Fusarium solani-melongenae]|uniref:Uncharacterized protein n=1 Tax=Fusarium solani subsp. cucurbitae TaxID=2747967 RepID=A0ACD3ZNX6_FUSSC|nr:hypothetical protein LCI18_013740 [Fusarium solani-melongenae]